MTICLDTIIKLYQVFQVEYIVIAVVAVVIVILCNLASCIYHRVLAKDDTKNFLIINVLNGHLAIFYQLTSVLYLGLIFFEYAEISQNEAFNELRRTLIQIALFYFGIKMTQMTVAIATKHYKPGQPQSTICIFKCTYH